ncbi:hypothetical protein ACFV9C_42235 [Kribbella sp. NPDC059898]|uniref:hypothetical protein n=1 Tax=Kribbella sp. NPDC059898 TaxID=3346995 RepID=UPI00364B702E
MTEIARRQPTNEPASASSGHAAMRRRILAALLEHTITFDRICFCGQRFAPWQPGEKVEHLAAVIAEATGLKQAWSVGVLAIHAGQVQGTEPRCACGAEVRETSLDAAAEHQAEALTAAIPTVSIQLYLNWARTRASEQRLTAPDARLAHVLGHGVR